LEELERPEVMLFMEAGEEADSPYPFRSWWGPTQSRRYFSPLKAHLAPGFTKTKKKKSLVKCLWGPSMSSQLVGIDRSDRSGFLLLEDKLPLVNTAALAFQKLGINVV
jgi:hypothetical protein